MFSMYARSAQQSMGGFFFTYTYPIFPLSCQGLFQAHRPHCIASATYAGHGQRWQWHAMTKVSKMRSHRYTARYTEKLHRLFRNLFGHCAGIAGTSHLLWILSQITRSLWTRQPLKKYWDDLDVFRCVSQSMRFTNRVVKYWNKSFDQTFDYILHKPMQSCNFLQILEMCDLNGPVPSSVQTTPGCFSFHLRGHTRRTWHLWSHGRRCLVYANEEGAAL